MLRKAGAPVRVGWAKAAAQIAQACDDALRQAHVMRLSKADRARLLDRVIAGLDEDAETEVQWERLAEERDAELESGALAPVPLEEAMARLRSTCQRASERTTSRTARKCPALNPGRWNEEGVAVVYTAENRSLAVLETLAAIPPLTLPMNRFLIRIDVPESTWREREILEPNEARKHVPTWDAIPSAGESASFGTAWCRSMRSALLCVPSVIVPEEQVVLINPGLVKQNGMRAQAVRRVDCAAAARRAPGSS